MLDVIKIDHVGIRVADKQLSLDFYQALGYKLVADVGFDQGHPVIMQHSSGVVLNLLGPASPPSNATLLGKNILMDIEDKHPGYTHIALHIHSVADAETLFEQLDIEITGRHNYKGLRSIFIRDPDRNVLELVEHTGPSFFVDTEFAHHV